MPHPDPRAHRHGGLIAIALLVSLAAGLRLMRVRLGLPDFLEEAIPLRLALDLKDVATGRIDWNPHNFNYPSLSIYVHFAVQQLAYGFGRLVGAYHSYADYMLSFGMDPTPMVIPARLVGVVCDAAAVWGVVRIGERLARGAGLVAGTIAAFSPILIASSSSIFCDSLMGVLAVWALERMMAWHANPRRRDLIKAAVLVGLATGAKYPAGVLVAPLVWLVVHRLRGRAFAACAGTAALAFAVFVVTTPFAALDPHAFLRDFSFEGSHAAGGHFGSVGHASFEFHIRNLTASLGWIGMPLVLLSLPLFARDRELRPAILALWFALLGFGLPISLASIDAERYLVPVIPIATILATAAGAALIERLAPAPRPRAPAYATFAAAATLALVVPVMVRGVAIAAVGSDTTQLAARRWCEAHVGTSELIVQEGYAARLPSYLRIQDVIGEPVYRSASETVRARFARVRPFHVVTLPLAVAGPITNELQTSRGASMRLEVMPHAGELNRVFYDARLFGDADYFVTSGAVRGRFEADSARFPAQGAFYRLLDTHSVVAARFKPRRGAAGPEIVVHRLGQRFRDAALAHGGFDSRWWLEAIPADYRARAEQQVGAAADSAGGGPGAIAESTPIWARTLAALYSERIQAFVADMATELAVLGRDASARSFARATLEVWPGDLNACLIYGSCSARLGDWNETRAATARALAAQRPGAAEPALVLLHARSLARTGARAKAAAELESLMPRLQGDDPVAAAARDLLAQLAPAARGKRAGDAAVSTNE